MFAVNACKMCREILHVTDTSTNLFSLIKEAKVNDLLTVALYYDNLTKYHNEN